MHLEKDTYFVPESDVPSKPRRGRNHRNIPGITRLMQINPPPTRKELMARRRKDRAVSSQEIYDHDLGRARRIHARAAYALNEEVNLDETNIDSVAAEIASLFARGMDPHQITDPNPRVEASFPPPKDL